MLGAWCLVLCRVLGAWCQGAVLSSARAEVRVLGLTLYNVTVLGLSSDLHGGLRHLPALGGSVYIIEGTSSAGFTRLSGRSKRNILNLE